MSSVQELLAASRNNSRASASPFLSLMEGFTQGVGQSIAERPQRQQIQLQIQAQQVAMEQVKADRAREEEAQAQMRKEMLGQANSHATNLINGAAVKPAPVMAGAKVTFEQDEKGRVSKKTVYENNPTEAAAVSGGPETMVKDGREYQVVRDAKGGVRYQPLTPLEKPASEGERLTRGFADRAQQAEDELTNIIAGGYDPTALFSTRGEFVPNAAKNEKDQMAEQAMRNFVSAVLRKESGAAIPPDELRAETLKYFPMRGDKDGVVAQKKRAREQAVRNLIAGAGKAPSTYKKPEAAPFGGGPAVGAVEDGYRFKGGDPKKPESWEKI